MLVNPFLIPQSGNFADNSVIMANTLLFASLGA